MGWSIDQVVTFIGFGSVFGLVIMAWIGWQQIRSANRLPFFMLKRKRIAQGWRLLLLGAFFALIALFTLFFGRQVAYTIVPPTPSITPTMTVTVTPTITLTPTITPVPTVTPTPSITVTPSLPESIRSQIKASVTPGEQAAFSTIQIARKLGNFNKPIGIAESFILPVGRLYGAFSYNNLQNGIPWTALWYRGNEIICSESKPWDGGTGGYGYTECEPEQWLEGEYEIQMFLGEFWKVSARFRILSEAATETITPQLTATP